MVRLAAACVVCCAASSVVGCGAVSVLERQFGMAETPNCTAPGECPNAAAEAQSLYCFRTLGTVDCHTDDDPYGVTATGRTLSHPIIRREKGNDAG